MVITENLDAGNSHDSGQLRLKINNDDGSGNLQTNYQSYPTTMKIIGDATTSVNSGNDGSGHL